MSLRISQVAEYDIEQAANWYEDQRPELREQFKVELAQVFKRIESNPLQFAQVRGGRRALLQKFPYTVYFRLAGEDALILAVFHQKRLQPPDLG